VIPVVAGSNPVGHPTIVPRAPRAAFQAALQDSLARIEASARATLRSDDPEALHQLRVGLRRLRSALRAFRDILERRQAGALARRLRRLSPKLGAARDWDVLVERLDREGAPAQLLCRAREKRDRARASARRAVASKAFGKLLERARALRAAEGAPGLAAASLARAHAKVMKQARGVDWTDAAARHAVRIRVKRLRYACEFFASAFAARRAMPYVAALKELQEILGELNDIAVARRLVGYEVDEKPLLRRLDGAWTRFARRPVFWRASA
jgi:triphosphatase